MSAFPAVRALLVAAAVSASATAVQASPVSYTMLFTGANAPTSGSFLYDTDLAVFTDFTVNWAGFTIDMTSAANAGIVLAGGDVDACGSPAPAGAAGAFSMLTGALPCNDRLEWIGLTGPGAALFTLAAYNDGPDDIGAYRIRTGFTTDGGDRSSRGAYTVAAAAVPEPGSAALGLLALAAAALVRRRCA